DGLGVGGVDGGDVVAVADDRVPAEGPGPLGVGVEVPAVHGLARLAQAVDVDDGGDVVEAVVGGVLERLPDGALGDLRVAAQHRHEIGGRHGGRGMARVGHAAASHRVDP